MGSKGKYQKTYELLFDKLVPVQDCAVTIEGELLRCATNLMYDYYNNGSCNMADGVETQCDYCNGSGSLDNEDYVPDDEDNDEDMFVDCDWCDGYGYTDGRRKLSDRAKQMVKTLKEYLPEHSHLVSQVVESITGDKHYNYDYNHEDNKPYELLMDGVVEFAINKQKEV